MNHHACDTIQFTRTVRVLTPVTALALGMTGSARAGNELAAISFSHIGAKASADYHGDALAITATAEGARLKCGFQKLEGQATAEGLWLTSTVSNAVSDRFRVMAVAVGRDQEGGQASSRALTLLEGERKLGLAGTLALLRGRVTVEDKVARFTRPGLVEEYSVSVDGVRQDFVVADRPAGAGELAVGLAVAGARVEAMPGGARLVLERSGRQIAYSRLCATDATGRELSARIEVLGSMRSPFQLHPYG
jgi:hypothetical protein